MIRATAYLLALLSHAPSQIQGIGEMRDARPNPARDARAARRSRDAFAIGSLMNARKPMELIVLKIDPDVSVIRAKHRSTVARRSERT